MDTMKRGVVAEETVALLYLRKPELVDRHGRRGHAKCLDDVRQTVLFLAEALATDSYSLFRDYVGWLRSLFANLGISVEDLGASLECLAEVAQTHLPEPDGARAAAMLAAARRDLDGVPVNTVSLIAGDAPAAALARAYLETLLGGDKRHASGLILAGVEGGMSVREVYLQVFQPVLREVGRLWHANRITVADEHFVTAATQAAMSRLYPYIFTGETRSRSMVATCVSGELHEIGMRMVADFFEMAGWDSHYLGANVPRRDVVGALKARRAAVLGISATLGRHLGQVMDLVALTRAEVGPAPIILVGGHPFNIDPDLWRRVGADGMAADADLAVGAVAAIEATR